jgi:spermidine synthase
VLSPELAGRAEKRADETAQRYSVERIPPEGLELDSDYSDIVIRDVGPMRALYFKRDDGSLVLQSRVSLAEPDRLLLGYQQSLFTSYLFVPEPARVLIVGLGGGGMVRFLQSRDPGVAVDAVEIDPVVVDVAQRYFGTMPSETVRLLEADGYDFIRQSQDRYDVIYMDVFLRPSDETDAAGAALRIKDAPFYAAMADHLTPQGVVAFNLLPHPERDGDVRELRQAFPQVYVFEVKAELNWIAIATRDPRRVELAELRQRAAALDARFAGSLSFADMIGLYQTDQAATAAGAG